MKILKDENGYGSLNINYQFFIEYMPKISGDGVKLYLYLCYLYEVRKDITQNGVMKALNMSAQNLKNAADEIKREGLISVVDNAIYVNDVAELKLRKKYALGGVPEREFYAEQTEEEKLFAEAIKEIQDKFFGGRMGPRWLEFLRKLNGIKKMTPDLLLLLFEHCAKYCDRGLTMAYVEAVAENWIAEGVKTPEDLNNYLNVRVISNKFMDFIRKKMNRLSPFMDGETEVIKKWLFDYGYGEEEVSLVLDWTKFNNPTIGAFDKVLSDWHSKSLKNAAEIKAYLEKNKTANTKKDGSGKKGSSVSVSAGGPAGNFTQREYDAEHYEWLMTKDNPEANKRRIEKMSLVEVVLEELREKYFGGVIPPRWRDFLKELNHSKKLSPELILPLFEYCKKHGNHRITMAYVEQVADEWLEQKIQTVEELELYLKSLEPFENFTLFMKQKMGHNTPFLDGETLMMKKWFFNYGYDESIVSLMIERVKLENPSVGAFDKILSSWYGAGLKNTDDVKLYIEGKAKAEGVSDFEKNAG